MRILVKYSTCTLGIHKMWCKPTKSTCCTKEFMCKFSITYTLPGNFIKMTGIFDACMYVKLK